MATAAADAPPATGPAAANVEASADGALGARHVVLFYKYVLVPDAKAEAAAQASMHVRSRRLPPRKLRGSACAPHDP